jgi:DTW domain-containing protein YfiP
VSQRSKTPSDLEGRCPRCWQLDAHCICAQVPQIQSRVRFFVLRHAKERWRSTNTARIAALALPGTEILDYGLRDALPLQLSQLPVNAHLLYPTRTRRRSSALDDAESSFIRVVLPDGNWRQAGRLARRLARAPSLYPLSLEDVQRAPHTLRRSVDPTRLSTIEAMAACLVHFGERENAEQLRALYRAMVEASVAGRGGRNLELLGAPKRQPLDPAET